MDARDQVAAALTASLPAAEWVVMPYARDIDPPSKATVMVRADVIRPSGLPGAWREYDFALLVITPLTDPAAADAELDDLVEDVLHAVDESRLPTWTSATRGSFEEKFPCYEVALTVTVTKES